MPFVAIVFGWPAVIASIVITLTGIAVSRWRVAGVGTLVGSPFLFYLLLTPRFGTITPFVGLSYYAAVYALARGQRALAVAFVIPFMALAAFVASLVVRQFAG